MMTQKSPNLMCEIHLNKAEKIENRQKFEKLLIEAVDEYLSCLGDSHKNAIYLHMHQQYGIRREEIPNQIKKFAEAIEESFGQGATLIEIGIIKTIYEKSGIFNYLVEQKELTFVDYLEKLRLQI